VTLDSGDMVDGGLINRTIDEQLAALKAQVGDNFFATGKYAEAADVFRTLTLADKLEPFLTVPAYEHFFSK
jgi:malate synthase